jgi:hypothetical protein
MIGPGFPIKQSDQMLKPPCLPVMSSSTISWDALYRDSESSKVLSRSIVSEGVRVSD